jgi:hypothetical protein
LRLLREAVDAAKLVLHGPAFTDVDQAITSAMVGR